MNCTMMCWLEKRTLMRGRSLVPEIFLRMRQWRRVASRDFLSVLILLHRLAFLAPDLLAGIANSLALVRLRRIVTANFRGHLADQLFARTFDGQLGVFLDRHFDLVGDGIIDRVGIPQRQVDLVALHGRFEADAL